jgi:hypothetical protein
VTGDSALADPDATEERSRRDLAVRALVVVALLAVTSIVLLVGPSDESKVRGPVGPQEPPAPSRAFAVAPATATPATGAPSGAYRTQPTPSPSQEPSASTAQAVGSLVATTAVVRSWQSDGITRAQVLAEVHNGSPTPIEFVPSGSRYRILDRAGHEVTHGVFTYAAPDRIAPGKDAYLIDTVTTLFAQPGDIVKVEVEPATRPTQTTATLLPTQDVEVRRANDGGLAAMGAVTNNTGAVVDSAFVCIVFVGRDGQLLGGVYDLTDVRQLAAGGSKQFTTSYPGTAPITPQDVARVDAIALQTDFAGD